MGEPCGWTIEQCGCGKCWDGLSPATREIASAIATTVMWAATGRRYGLCELTVLPCNPPAVEPGYQTYPVGGFDPWSLGGTSGLAVPVINSGVWTNQCGAIGCTCRAACEVPLDGPVADVVDVFIDGEPLAGGYEIHNGFLLVRTDGQCWPTCQTFGVEVPEFEVVYHRGEPIPSPVQWGSNLLACEYGKACQGKDCGLPSRMTRLTRQGVEVQVADIPKDGKGRIRTGLRLVDDVIDADNPYGLAERTMVTSPDLVPPRVVTWRSGS